jgi:hypothetical protein
MRRLPVICLLVTLPLGLVSASAHAATSCHTIQATGVGSGAPPQPGDPANLVRTRARLSDAGLLQGTTQAAFTIVAPTPVGFAFAGNLVVSTNRATLTVALTGTLDVTTGDFTATGPVAAATGKLSGASGQLTLSGVQDLADPAGSFTETVTGDICVDLGANGQR